MKKHKLLLILLISTCFASAGVCSTASFQNTLQNRLKIQDAESVSNKANNYSYSSPMGGMMSDPMINSMMNSGMNMLQNGSSNTFQQMDQARQQADYAKQQGNYSQNEDEN